jgi:hypothetical protein
MTDTWNDIKVGSTITVSRKYRTRPFRLMIRSIDQVTASGRYALVTGDRLTMGGQPSSLPATIGSAGRDEMLYIGDVTAVE